MHLVVGLGNPGHEYRDNRHNVGFMVVDELLARARGSGAARPSSAPRSRRSRCGGERVLLCKPMEFMNLSGQAVAQVAGFWKIPVADTVVVHDELDVPFGRLKLAAGGGPGGHNGVRSLIADLGDPTSPRVRFGIGRPAPGRDAADYVLADFSKAEQKDASRSPDAAADAVEAILAGGLAAAMNKFNGKAVAAKQ